MFYYAVRKGVVPGIYESWEMARQQVENYAFPSYKKFDTKAEAEDFMNGMRQTTMDNFVRVPTVEQLVCFTDGSTPRNGDKNAKGGCAVVWPDHSEYNTSFCLENTTNNRCEYSAVIRAFEQAVEIDPECKKTLIIYTDSMLIVNSMTKWLSGWKRNNYIKSDGKPVLNDDLIKTVDEHMKARRCVFKHTPAHTLKKSHAPVSGSPAWEALYNDKADKLARTAAEN